MTTAVRRPSLPASGDSLTGCVALLRFALRRDRFRLPLWILGIWLVVVSTAVSFPAIYRTPEDRAGALLTLDNPGTAALIGAVYGDGDYTYGMMTGHNLLVLVSVVAGLMSIFTLVRHTRAEEEAGRTEVLRSMVVGRHAHAVSALILVVGANVVLALVLAVGLAGPGIETITWEGSLLFGAGVASVGLVFAGVAGVTAQLTENARTASSSAGLVLILAYLVRAIGDVSNPALSWFSPIGWVQATEVYDADNWAPLGIELLAAVVLVAVAVPLSTRRDIGAGVLGTRPGPARAGALLRGPFGLAWRLSRGMIIGWTFGLFAFGLVYGPVLSEASTYLDELPAMGEFLPNAEASGAELFGAAIIAVAAILCVIPALQVVLRLRSEENSTRAGALLSTPLSRGRWMGASLLLGFLTAVVTLAIMGLGIGLGAGWSMDDAGWVGTSVLAAVSYLPAVAVVLGFGALLVGWLPRAAGWSWALVGFATVIMYLGGILSLPQTIIDLSPFSHIPQQPAVEFDAVPLAWLTLVAVVLTAAGLVGMRRRDLQEA